MAAPVINSTVYLEDADHNTVCVLVGTELAGDFAWVADRLKKDGTFGRLTGSEDGAGAAEKDLGTMNKAELAALAAERGIDIKSNATKAEILDALAAGAPEATEDNSTAADETQQ